MAPGGFSLIATLADGALALGVGRLLVVFAAVCAFGFSFVFAFVVETKGQSLEEIARRVASQELRPAITASSGFHDGVRGARAPATRAGMTTIAASSRTRCSLGDKPWLHL